MKSFFTKAPFPVVMIPADGTRLRYTEDGYMQAGIIRDGILFNDAGSLSVPQSYEGFVSFNYSSSEGNSAEYEAFYTHARLRNPHPKN